MPGVTLIKDTFVVLSVDGTLVYVEDIQPHYAAVVALPDQPLTRQESPVFIPGRVGAKKISPYSGFETCVELAALSHVNQQFMAEFLDMRRQHGVNYVHGAPTVTQSRSLSSSDKQKRRRNKRELRRLQKCATCGQQPGHIHHPSDHEFVPPAPRPEPGEKRTAKGAKRARLDHSATYHVVSTDLTKAQEVSPRFNPGNRFYRVFAALNKLPDSKGTHAEIVKALLDDGGRAVASPEKVAKRALKLLTSDACGAVVKTV